MIEATEEKSIITGAISVKAVLEERTRDVYNVYINNKKSDKNTEYINKICKNRNIKINDVDSSFFEDKEFGNSHGGIAAQIGQRSFCDEEELLSQAFPFIALLEGIEDPFNFGCALRSLYAAGATGLVLPVRNWMSASATVIRASAGASERIKTAVCPCFDSFLKKAKEKNISVICAERKNASPLYGENLNKALVLAIGGEKRGLSTSVTSNSDKNIFIPYGQEFRNSLSASAATAVFAFEIMRQRNIK